MDIQDFRALFAFGEQRNIECKASISWADPVVKAKIVKSILGMSNISNGGFLIIGVEQREGRFDPVGMQKEDISSFIFDEVSAEVSKYADPYTVFKMEIVKDGEKEFLVFIISEFDSIPVICKRDGRENLKQGGIYTRSRRIPETCLVQTASDLREILEMATEKGVKKFIETSQKVGVKLPETNLDEEYKRDLEGILCVKTQKK